MVTLEQAKNYLKIDTDITDDDNLVTSLINAAGDYIKRTTGKINTNANRIADFLISDTLPSFPYLKI